MRSRVNRSAVAVIGGLLCSMAVPSAASATDFSIDTTVPGGWVGIDGFTSFGFRGGVIRVVPDLEPADGFVAPRSAASFSEIAMGELLVPV